MKAANEFAAATAADLHALASVKAQESRSAARQATRRKAIDWATTTGRAALDLIASAQTEATVRQKRKACWKLPRPSCRTSTKLAKERPKGVPGADYASAVWREGWR